MRQMSSEFQGIGPLHEEADLQVEASDNASGENYGDDTQSSGEHGFDGYDVLDVPLGDLFRGERATLGKSLLDVERELKIRAAYIAAIENGDIGAFQSTGFIAGYVRSYSRYLNIDPEWAFRRFCAETGFNGVHGAQANTASKLYGASYESPRRLDPNDVMSSARVSISPVRESAFSNLEPGALGSIAVLVVLALGIGYGALAILNDIQRVQIAEVDENTVLPFDQMDPVDTVSVTESAIPSETASAELDTLINERLFRPQTLEAPVFTPRDGPLASLDPSEIGALTGDAGEVVQNVSAGAVSVDTANTPQPVQVTQDVDQVVIFATAPTWVRVTTSEGDYIHEATLNRGDSYVIPNDVGTAMLRSGNAGALYFAVNGEALGPAGRGPSIVRDVELTVSNLSSVYSAVTVEEHPEAVEVASLVVESLPQISAPISVPEPPELLVYDPDRPEPRETILYPDLPLDVARALVASNEVPVVVSAPGPRDARPQQRP